MHLKLLLSTLSFLIISLHTYAQGEWAIEIKEAQGPYAPLITADTVGNIYLGANSYDSTKPYPDTYLYIAKLNKDGNILWQQKSEYKSRLNDICYIDDLDILMSTGYFYNRYKLGNASSYSDSYFEALTNANGNTFSLSITPNFQLGKVFNLGGRLYSISQKMGNDTTRVWMYSYSSSLNKVIKEYTPYSIDLLAIGYIKTYEGFKVKKIVGTNDDLFILGKHDFRYNAVEQLYHYDNSIPYIDERLKKVDFFNKANHLSKTRSTEEENILGVIFNTEEELIIPYTIDSSRYKEYKNQHIDRNIYIAKATKDGKLLKDKQIARNTFGASGFTCINDNNDYYVTFSAKDYCYIGKKKYSFEGEYRSYILKMDNYLKIKSITYLSSPNTLRISSTVFSDGYIYCTGEFSGVLKHDLHTLIPSAKESTFLIKTKL